MQRYYFNIKDGKAFPDEEGTLLADLDAAKAEAVKLSGEVLRDWEAGQLWSGHPWELLVTEGPNTTGRLFFSLNFSAREAA
jgi:hypothetical protein